MVDDAGTCINFAKPAFPMNSVFFFILVKLSIVRTLLDVESLNLEEKNLMYLTNGISPVSIGEVSLFIS